MDLLTKLVIESASMLRNISKFKLFSAKTIIKFLTLFWISKANCVIKVAVKCLTEIESIDNQTKKQVQTESQKKRKKVCNMAQNIYI